ncbi:MAG: CARDB domain-containing protein [Candidatus Aenigmatarchaeota archaeon]
MSRYLETFVNKPINGTVEIKNIGDKSVTNVAISFINISSDIEYQVFPISYSRISPGETKTFTITFNPKKVGNYEVGINITSKEVFHLTEINLVVREAPAWPTELLTMIVLLWIIAGLVVMLTFASYKLYMRRKMKKLKLVEKPKEEEEEFLE